MARPRAILGEAQVLGLCADLATISRLSEVSPGELLVLCERLAAAMEATARSYPADESALRRLHKWLRKVVVPLVDQPDEASLERRARRSVLQLAADGPNSEPDAALLQYGPAGRFENKPPSELGALKLEEFLRAACGRQDWRVVRREDGEIAIEPNRPMACTALEHHVWQYVEPGATLPFARCEFCRRIFVRSRAQFFCSPNCATQANQQNRRAKVRENVRRYRERKRKTQKPVQ